MMVVEEISLAMVEEVQSLNRSGMGLMVRKLVCPWWLGGK
jgi:hypothetical protein